MTNAERVTSILWVFRFLDLKIKSSSRILNTSSLISQNIFRPVIPRKSSSLDSLSAAFQLPGSSPRWGVDAAAQGRGRECAVENLPAHLATEGSPRPHAAVTCAGLYALGRTTPSFRLALQ